MKRTPSAVYCWPLALTSTCHPAAVALHSVAFPRSSQIMCPRSTEADAGGVQQRRAPLSLS